jgi:hypothetical protein
MKNYLLMMLVSLSLVAVLSGSARALDDSPFHLTANISFTFYVGNTKLPPGKYTISQFGEADENVFELRSADDKISVLIEGQAIQAESMPAKTQIFFKKYGDKEILYQIFVAGQNLGFEITASAHEKRAAKTGTTPQKHAVEATGATATKKTN